MFRKGKALGELGYVEKAEKVLKELLKKNPAGIITDDVLGFLLGGRLSYKLIIGGRPVTNDPVIYTYISYRQE